MNYDEREFREGIERWREGVERWIDERIDFACRSLAHPFEKRISRLQQRIRETRKRLQHVHHQMEEGSPENKSS